MSSSSLTPASRNAEATEAATHEGLVNGFLTLFPTSAGLYLAMQNPKFLRRTNWQSRTAMVIMPALFVFAWTAEHKLSSKMREIASETRHSRDTVHWAEQEMQANTNVTVSLTDLYQRSVAESGVVVVPELKWYHQAANYAADHPIQILTAAAVPAIAGIAYGRAGQGHLEVSQMIMHTRVFGQFATITALLTVMGFKEYMERHGKFVSQADADRRVEEMHEVRANLLERLRRENELKRQHEEEIKHAHEEMVKERRHHKAEM